MIRRLCALALLLLGGCHHQSDKPRFRYTLRESPDESADDLRVRDSTVAAELRQSGCPSFEDTLWTGDRRAKIPRRWLDASLRFECAYTLLPLSVRRRLRDDRTSLAYYAAVVRRSIPSSEWGRAIAVRTLSWSGERGSLPLILAVASETSPGIVEDGDYNAAYWATFELAPYVSDSREARGVVLRAATHPTSRHARAAGILSLAAANDRWSRDVLRRIPIASADEYVQTKVARALAHPPCGRGTMFVEWFGFERQDHSKCEPPPDYR
jgi:hypothetical protein